jgi:hypothetical protein
MNPQIKINTIWQADDGAEVVIDHIHTSGESKGLVTGKLVRVDRSISKSAMLLNPDKLKPLTK